MVPGFLMATLNPGRSTRRRKTRRKLSAWQRLVKKAGGVLQAVKLRRARKGRGRKRRNPFLSTSSAAVAPLMNARRRRKKNRTRRSAVSRRSLRSRSRKSLGRRPKMAKVRHRRRRRVLRGKGGRFVTRRRKARRSRRTRRNPVVPISWNPRRKRRRSRRNPLFLSKRGFSGRKHRGYRQLHRRRRRPHFWHNPVVPISWNPRKRRGGRRRYRNNPVLPYFAMNPGNAVGEIMGKLKSMIDVSFWTETGMPVAVGFFGSKVVGSKIYDLIPASILSYVPTPAAPFVRATVNTLAGAALSWGAGRFMSKKAGDNIWLGTVVGVAADLIKTLLDTYVPGFSSSIGLSGLGSSLDDKMKDAITQRVRNNLNGYLTVRNVRENAARPVNGLGATYVTTKFGRGSYDPTPRLAMAGDIADDSTQL